VTGGADFLMCVERGCYVGATMETDRPADAQIPRRTGRWTPGVRVEAQPNA
jgi:hypothetical protein